MGWGIISPSAPRHLQEFLVPDQISAAFISYCRDDQEFALRLAQDLKDAGAAVWLDQLDIKPGHPWDNAVEGALRAATKMLVILTPTSVSSENVRDEIAYALKQGKIVIPVLYMECEIPLRLERKQHIDFRANYARGLDLLLRQLRVDHPNQAVLEKAAEGDAQRQLAWQAREAETGRLRELAEQQQRDQADRQTHDELRQKQEAEALEAEVNRRVQASLREVQERADRKPARLKTSSRKKKDRRTREEALRRQEAEDAAKRQAEAAEELRRQQAAARKGQEEAERQEREAEAKRVQELAARQQQEEAQRRAREEVVRRQEAERLREAKERAKREAEAARLKEVQVKARRTPPIPINLQMNRRSNSSR